MVFTWWRQRTDQKLSAPARRRHRADPRKVLFRPRLEALEDRLSPAVHTWTGAVSTSWSDARNWIGGSPYSDNSADLVFPSSGVARFISTHDAGASPILRSIRFEGNDFFVNTTQPNNPARLSGDILANNTAGVNTLALAINFVTLPATLHRFEIAPGGTLGVTSPITQAPGAPFHLLQKDGPGTLILSANNSYGGGTRLNGGTLIVGHNGALGVGQLQLNGGTIQPISGTIELANPFTVLGIITVSGGANLTFRGSGTILAAGTLVVANTQLAVGLPPSIDAFRGTLSGPGKVIKSGAGTLLLSGNNSYTGGTALNAGTLIVGHNGALGVGQLQLNGGTIQSGQFSPTIHLANPFTVGDATVSGSNDLSFIGPGTILAGRTLGADTKGVVLFAGSLSGPGRVTKSGAGRLVLSGSNSYTGGTHLNAGILSVEHNNALGPGALQLNGGTIQQSGRLSSNITLANPFTVGDVTVGIENNTGNNPTLTFTGPGTILAGGTLGVDNIGGSFVTFSGNLSGSGGVRKTGVGTLVLAGANSYAGRTNVAGGSLRLASNSGVPSTSAVTVAAEFHVDAFDARIGSLAGAGTVIIGPLGTLRTGADNTSTTFSGFIGGFSSSTLVKEGTGTMTLSGATVSQVFANVLGGTLAGVGSVDSLFVSNGSTLSPGIAGPGILNTRGVTLRAASLRVDLNGTSAGSGYDQLKATGPVNLDGPPTLNVALGFEPAVGDAFTIITSSGNVSGTFDGLPDNARFSVSGKTFRINYAANSVVLTRVPSVATTQLRIDAVASGTAGVPFDVSVTALDASGNVDATYRGTVHFTSSDGGATLPADYTFTADDAGVHSFAGGVTLVRAGSQTVSASDTVSSSVTGSTNVDVSPAAADHFRISVAPSVISSIPFDVTVTALDPFGNVDTNYSGTVRFTSSDTDPAVVLPADYTFTAGAGGDNGVHTFSSEFILITPGDQTVTATDTVSAITGSALVTVEEPNGPPPGAGSQPGRNPRLLSGWESGFVEFSSNYFLNFEAGKRSA